MSETSIEILKTVWSHSARCGWEITSLKPLTLRPKSGFSNKYFQIDSQIEMMSSRPSSNSFDLFSSFGSTEFLIRQSIVPVIMWLKGKSRAECIGTASVISCTGYLLTAGHVLMHPIELGYTKNGNHLCTELHDDVEFGVIIPYMRPGSRGYYVAPFEKYCIWGKWAESPIISSKPEFKYSSDIAIAKIPQLPLNAAYQPLSMSLNNFIKGERAYTIGYAEMKDIHINWNNNGFSMSEFSSELTVSIGNIIDLFPTNHIDNIVPTPGPCFDFNARIPGKMSGAPIFGANGVVVRGVVSRSFSNEEHAYGSMLSPVIDLPIEPAPSEKTLRHLIGAGNDGIPEIHGQGL